LNIKKNGNSGSLIIEISKNLEPNCTKKSKKLPNTSFNRGKKDLSIKTHKVEELYYPMNLSPPICTSYKKVLALKIVKILILSSKFLGDFISEGDLFVISFVL
jgi:hypothetical protein